MGLNKILQSSKNIMLASVAALSLSLAATPANAESLRAALASAYATNPNIASALISVKASAEDIAIRRAGKLPTISATADYTHSWTVAGGSLTENDTSSLGLTYRQTLFDNLKTDAQIEQARAFSVVATQALRNAEQNVLLSAATSYFNVIRDTQLVQLRADNVAFFRAQKQAASDRLNIGEGTRIEVSQADARLASSVASYKNAITGLQVSQAGYQRWVGHSPRNLGMAYDFGGSIPGSLDQALNLADVQHPAIMTAYAQIRAAQSASDAAAAAFGPTLDLIGSIVGNTNFGTGTNAINGSVRLSLTIPLYAGGALGAGARQANLNQIKSELDALATRDQVRESVISAWNGVQNANAQIASAQSAASSSQLVLNGVIEEQKVGQRTILDVLNSRSELTSSREILISAQSSKLIASFSLLSAVGRLSAADLNLPVQIRTGQGYSETVEDIWSELRSIPNN